MVTVPAFSFLPGPRIFPSPNLLTVRQSRPRRIPTEDQRFLRLREGQMSSPVQFVPNNGRDRRRRCVRRNGFPAWRRRSINRFLRRAGIVRVAGILFLRSPCPTKNKRRRLRLWAIRDQPDRAEKNHQDRIMVAIAERRVRLNGFPDNGSRRKMSLFRV